MLTRSPAHPLTRPLLLTALAMIAAPAFAQRDIQPVARELPQFVPGSMWVKLDADRPQAHDSTMRVVRALAGVEQTKTFWLVPGLHLVRVPTGDERAFVSLLGNLEGVEWTSLEGVGTTTQTCVPADRQCQDAYCPDQYWIDNVNLRDAWAVLEEMQLPLVTVAVIDSGVNYNHPDLIDSRWENPGEFGGATGVDDDNNGIIDDQFGAAFVQPPLGDPCGPGSACYGDPFDCSLCDTGAGDPVDTRNGAGGATPNCGIDMSADDGYHGTACASIMAATANNDGTRGISCNIRVMGVRVFHRCFAGGFSESSYVDGLSYAVQNGASVISSSLQLLPDNGTGQAMRLAIKQLGYSDVLFVTSAGNLNQNIDNPVNPSFVLPPQDVNWDHVLTVGATDSSDMRASFSNWGLQTVDLFAPGVDIRVFDTNTAPGAPFADGTSFAAPIVAGAAALYRSLHPTASADDTAGAVKASVRPVPSLSTLCESGGILDVHNLLVP